MDCLLQFNFKGQKVISGISTQGRERTSERVSSYKVAYKTFSSPWKEMTNESDMVMVIFKLFSIIWDKTVKVKRLTNVHCHLDISW